MKNRLLLIMVLVIALGDAGLSYSKKGWQFARGNEMKG